MALSPFLRQPWTNLIVPSNPSDKIGIEQRRKLIFLLLSLVLGIPLV